MKPNFENQANSAPAVPALPSIYSFNDLSHYLKAIYEFKRAKNPRLSLGAWSRKLGIKGNGTLSNIISGRRIPRPEILNKIRFDLELTEYQQIYFDALIASSEKNQNPVLKRVTRNLLVAEKSGEQYHEMNSAEFELVADPLFMVLREAVKIEGFQNDPKWIAEHLTLIDVSEDRIRSALDTLLSVGLLRKDGDRYVQDDRHFKTLSDQPSEALRSYYEACLELNQRAIREVPKTERHLNSITFSCAPEDLAELKEMVHAFSRTLMERFDRPDATKVYQLHTQLIPHFSSEKADS
jgi:uncharacterized protein (TIGR02147 family)